MSEQRFMVGEIAIAQNCTLAENNGKEVEILALPRDFDWINPNGLRVFAGRYWCQGPAHTVQLQPHHLRKKRDQGSWAQCAWQPAGVRV